jgi:hypothetical protein
MESNSRGFIFKCQMIYEGNWGIRIFLLVGKAAVVAIRYKAVTSRYTNALVQRNSQITSEYQTRVSLSSSTMDNKLIS